MAQVVKELSVCTDCFMYVAIGVESLDDIDDTAEAIIINGVNELSEHGYVVTGDETYGFCFPPCECCKRKLGGDRFQVLVLN